jgi:hypothetical protein
LHIPITPFNGFLTVALTLPHRIISIPASVQHSVPESGQDAHFPDRLVYFIELTRCCNISKTQLYVSNMYFLYLLLTFHKYRSTIDLSDKADAA